MAFDKTSRNIDVDGRLHVSKSHISKAAVNPYYGKEIPGFEDLGLDPNRIYKLFRDPEELEKSASTFARLPILSQHVPVNVDAPRKDLIVGTVGSEVEFNFPYLDSDLCFWEAEAIAGIENDKIRELSSAYRYVPVMEPGEFEGVAYDGRMTNIEGNHLALVEVGRAGSDVVVADQSPFITFRDKTMKMTRLGKALFSAFAAVSPKLAADSALPSLFASARKKDFEKSEVKKQLISMDATLSPQQLDNVIDALLDVEQDPEPVQQQTMAAADGSPAEKLRGLLAGKVDENIIKQACDLMMPEPEAKDSIEDMAKNDMQEEKGMKKEEVKAAMDSLRQELREAEQARRDVRPVVGDVIGMDSAEEVYKFALDHMKVDHEGLSGSSAVRALFRAVAARSSVQPVAIAQDSSGLLSKFPEVARFRSI